MEKIEFLLKTGRISRINEDEKQRYLNFFSHSYKENLDHCKFNLEKFPRWSIISGYYAMHDLSKLFLADNFSIKVEFNVHETTILVLKEIVKDKQTIEMLNLGYSEFIRLLNDLVTAKNKRTKAQYYTGTAFMQEEFKKQAHEFLEKTVVPFIDKIKESKNDYKSA